MNGLQSWTWSYDGWVMLGGLLCAVAASLPGNFLVLRRMSLLGDAVSHAVLPGLALAFWITQSRSGLPVFAGAVTTGLITAMLTQWIRDVGKVDEGASIGVVFTTLFAAGLLLMSQAAPRVDLDPGCVLYGVLEASPLDTITVAGFAIPRVVLMLSIVLLINIAFIVLLFKELLISSFDPGLATTAGCSARWMHYLLMVIVAITTVASFEATGNILVVAMLIVPPSTALLLTDRLSRMILISRRCRRRISNPWGRCRSHGTSLVWLSQHQYGSHDDRMRRPDFSGNRNLRHPAQDSWPSGCDASDSRCVSLPKTRSH
ncbi:MAG UNVERIFIED_CONTAM: metal ABC transporter permease [Planctomycetaceae bacterium]|jgi:manganese/zinc/iron transport system permease protein